jgi:hypothetical protein
VLGSSVNMSFVLPHAQQFCSGKPKCSPLKYLKAVVVFPFKHIPSASIVEQFSPPFAEAKDGVSVHFHSQSLAA